MTMMSGADAQRVENLLALFAAITGRPATADERAQLARAISDPSPSAEP
jgi:hypothetical protein